MNNQVNKLCDLTLNFSAFHTNQNSLIIMHKHVKRGPFVHFAMGYGVIFAGTFWSDSSNSNYKHVIVPWLYHSAPVKFKSYLNIYLKPLQNSVILKKKKNKQASSGGYANFYE